MTVAVAAVISDCGCVTLWPVLELLRHAGVVRMLLLTQRQAARGADAGVALAAKELLVKLS